MEFKDFCIVSGLPASFDLEPTDETGIPYDLTFAAAKFEVFDEYDNLVFTKTYKQSTTIDLSMTETSIINDVKKLYRYRILLISLPSLKPVKELYRGVISVDNLSFGNELPGTGTLVLPDGALYPTRPTVLIPGIWYAIASFFRFSVTGAGTVSLDGMNVAGDITGNLSAFYATGSEPQIWYPALGANIEFRLNNIVGAPTVQYLP